MLANAWHHRSDSLSSIGAALGIGGAILLGEKGALLDPLASIVVGAMLVKVSWDLLNGCFSELTDHSLSDETEQEIEAIIRDTPGVSEPHNLRTRRIGNRIAIEAHTWMATHPSARPTSRPRPSSVACANASARIPSSPSTWSR